CHPGRRMSLPVVVQPRARTDLREAYQWLAERSPRAAARWFQGISRAIQSLTDQPERCPLAPEADVFPFPIRQLLYGKRTGVYRILFVVQENAVSVLAVRHAARDYLDPMDAPELDSD